MTNWDKLIWRTWSTNGGTLMTNLDEYRGLRVQLEDIDD